MSNSQKPKIYVCYENGGIFPGDLHGCAVAEDGEFLAGHVSSNEWYVRHDMGVENSDWHHDSYNKKYPQSFELVYVGHIENLPKEVLERNHAKAEEAPFCGQPVEVEQQ